MNTINQPRRLLNTALLLGPLLAHAQASRAYPEKTVRLIVPYPPGGSTDILARMLNQRYFPQSGQSVVVENSGGAGGNVGSQLVLRAPADGHALEIGGMSQHAMNGSLYKGLSFDPMADFVPAAMLAHVINVIAVAKDMPVNTFPELIAYIRAHPGKVNYSSGGIGSHNHLTLALLAKMANLDMTHVPYKGGGPAVQALVQGEVNMFAGGASLLVSQSRAGRVKLIAVTESKRSALLPDLPSASETIPGFEVSNWYGVFVRSGVPGPIVNQINQEVNRILQSPDTQEQLRSYFMSHEALSPADMKRLLQAEHKRWTETIKAMNITSE